MKLWIVFSIVFSIFINSTFAQITEMSPMPERVTNNSVVEGFVNGVPFVYSFAGLDSTKNYSGIHLRSFRYNTQTDIWESIPPLPDTLGKIATSASRIGDIIYIIGGYHVFSNGSEISSNRVHRYDIQTNTYLTDGASIPVPIDDQVQAVWKDSLIYVVTGWSNNQNVTNVQIYNPSTDEWTQGTPIPNESSYPSFGAAGVILNDTIYYFGGARNNDFAIQRHMRKGIINADDPTEIEWSAFILDWGVKAYRPGAFIQANDNLFWIGGADNTYNYDGIAYNNSQGIEPNHRVLYFDSSINYFQEQFFDLIPMDLRGVAHISDSVQYIAGGMESGQIVSNKTLKIGQINLLVKAENLNISKAKIDLFPNPVNQSLHFNMPENQNCSDLILKIVDLTGAGIMESKMQSCEAEIDISAFPSGVYLLSVFIDGKVLTKRFVKD